MPLRRSWILALVLVALTAGLAAARADVAPDAPPGTDAGSPPPSDDGGCDCRAAGASR
jgi:hypothetical protein